MPVVRHYMSRYDQEHSNLWNKILHAIGIPVIFAGLILLILARWRMGLALFAAGWVLLFLGHRIEGNRPAFFKGPIYFLVGPLWVAREIKQLFIRRSEGPAGIGDR